MTPMKYSLRSLMRLAFNFRDLFWLAVVMMLAYWWWADHWVNAYTNNLLTIMRDGEIRDLKEKLRESQAPAQIPPKD